MIQPTKSTPEQSNSIANNPAMQRLKSQVHRKLIETLDLLEAERVPREKLRDECARRVERLLTDQGCPLSGPEKHELVSQVMDEIFGLGPLELLLRDPEISDILINGSSKVYTEKRGVLEPTDVKFRDDSHLLQVIQRIASAMGRRIDESSPMLDARLSDGSRVNAIIPPLALDGPAMSIRRFGATPLDIDRLVELDALTPDMVEFLKACVASRINIIISGGTGSGKTTLLNSLSRWIPPGERVVTIEDAAELQLQREHVVRLETRPANIEGRGCVTQRELLINTLRMRPDRIVIGEVRGGEALDMLNAMNTGHEGSMTTVHANTPRDGLRRIENMVSMAGVNFPVMAIRQQMTAAIELVIQLGRVTGGRRRILNITELTGMEGDAILMQDLFKFHQRGVNEAGHAWGDFVACGVRSHVLPRLHAEGYKLPETMFQRRVLKEIRPAA